MWLTKQRVYTRIDELNLKNDWKKITNYDVDFFVGFGGVACQVILNLIGCLVKKIQVVIQWIGVMKNITRPDDTLNQGNTKYNYFSCKIAFNQNCMAAVL